MKKLLDSIRNSFYIGNLANGNRQDRRKAKRLSKKEKISK
jgi:hypothetical protein